MISHTYCPVLGSQYTFSKPAKQRPVLTPNYFPANVLKMQGVMKAPLHASTKMITNNLKQVLRKQFP